MTDMEFECWKLHLTWDAKAKSGDVSPEYVGDSKIYERWKGKVAEANMKVQVAAFEREKEQERRRFGSRPSQPPRQPEPASL